MHAAWDKSQAELKDCILERQKREARVLAVNTDMPADNGLTEDDYNVNQEDDSGTGPANTVSAVQYESEVAGRSLPAQKLPRFDLGNSCFVVCTIRTKSFQDRTEKRLHLLVVRGDHFVTIRAVSAEEWLNISCRKE